MKGSPDYLTPLLLEAPASWALIRANEIRALEKVSFDSPVLDVGCGDGVVAKVLLAGHGKKQFECGIDLSSREVNKAMRSGCYKECQVANVYNLPFKDNTFQTVFSNSVVEHLPKLDRALEEMSRVTKKGGELVLTVPTPYLAKYLIGASFFSAIGMMPLANAYGDFFNKLFKHYNLYTHQEWEKLLAKHHLKLIVHSYYHTPGMIKVHELLSYVALPVHLAKPLIGYWLVFPTVRKYFIVPWLKKILEQFYLADCLGEEGGSLMLVARKV